jgi:hypothetical protein
MRSEVALGALLLLSVFTARAAPAGTEARVVFQKLQSLAGDWEGKDADGMVAKTKFEVVAAKTAVLETIAMPGMEEMLTMYSVDGDSIALVHYCPTGNQPRMRVTPTSSDPKELVFEFSGAGNLPSPEVGHQHKLVIQFEDANHITETWTWRSKGKDTPMVFHFARKKN